MIKVGTLQVPSRTVKTRVPGRRPLRTFETSRPSRSRRARAASASSTRQVRPQSRSRPDTGSSLPSPSPASCPASSMTASPSRNMQSRTPQSGKLPIEQHSQTENARVEIAGSVDIARADDQVVETKGLIGCEVDGLPFDLSRAPYQWHQIFEQRGRVDRRGKPQNLISTGKAHGSDAFGNRSIFVQFEL